jgi:signal transduction histidine kinase
MIFLIKNARIFSLFLTILCFIYSSQAFAHDQPILGDDFHSRARFWSVMIVAVLLFIVIGLLLNNISRTGKSTAKLLELNNEITRQKEIADRINQHLEEIISDRTRDLQNQNKKLSAYSSYLSHQIRGPIATLKGLMNLERENLIDKEECIDMMNRCVSEIDEKIIEMSDMLHQSDRAT